MANFHLYSSNKISHPELVEKIKGIRENNKTLFISATANLREIRANDLLHFNPLTDNNDSFKRDKKYLEEEGIYSYQDFDGLIKNRTSTQGGITKNIRVKLELKNILETMPECNFYEHILEELFELYRLIEFYQYGRSRIEGYVRDIAKKYSKNEENIFKIYSKLSSWLGEEEKKEKVIFQNAYLKQIDSYLGDFKCLFLDGFLFFNDEQFQVIKCAYKKGLDIYFVAKFTYGKGEPGVFLKPDNFDTISRKCSDKQCEAISFSANIEEEDSRLSFLQSKFPNIPPERVTIPPEDCSLKIYRKFTNRHEEFEFIVGRINSLIKKDLAIPDDINIETYKKYLKDKGWQVDFRKTLIKELKKSLKKSCIVIASEKEKYESLLASTFEHHGLFVVNCGRQFNGKKLNFEFDGMPFFSKESFLHSTINFDDGVLLTDLEKYQFFHETNSSDGKKKHITHVSIQCEEKPLTSYPVGEFIFQIYNILNNELTPGIFIKILSSNWESVVNKDTKENWLKGIKSFLAIKVFFKHKKTIEDWLEVINELKNLKDSPNLSRPEYRWHPLTAVEKTQLLCLEAILKSISDMVGALDKEGSFKDHVTRLKENVLHHYDIKLPGDLSPEQDVVNKLKDAVNSIEPGVDEDLFSAQDFSTFVRSMVDDYQKEQGETDIFIPLEIDVVNLENMRDYDFTFFPACENTKYPRAYHEPFPYTPEIQEILCDKFSLQQKKYRGLDYHLKLEKYLIKNVIDFTKKRLTITHAAKELEEYNEPSVFLEDMASVLHVDLHDLYVSHPRKEQNETSDPGGASSDNLSFPDKRDFSLNELCTFIACPKSYFFTNQVGIKPIYYRDEFQLRHYCSSVLYVNSLEQFLDTHGKTTYHLFQDQYVKDFEEIIANTEVFKFFSFLNGFEQKDAKSRVLSSFQKAVNLYVSDGPIFTLSKPCNTEDYGGGTPKSQFKLDNDKILIRDQNLQVSMPDTNKWERKTTTLSLDFLHHVACKGNDDHLDANQKAHKKFNRLGSVNTTALTTETQEIMNGLLPFDFLSGNDETGNPTKVTDYCKYCKINRYCLADRFQAKEGGVQ
jgi:hypothetical protein